MKQTKRIVVSLLCLCIALTCIFTLAACGDKGCKHSDTEWVIAKEATATETGVKNEVCKDCSEILNTETIPATGNTDEPPTPNTPSVPTGLAINGTVLTWNAVTEATGYVVKIGDATHSVTETTLDIAALSLVPGSYSVSVQSVNADGSSDFSEAIQINYLTGDIALSYNNKTISWVPIPGASTYEVRVNGGEATTVTNANSASVKLTKKGDNVIEVRYTDGNGSDWIALNVTAYEVTYDSRSLSGGESVEYLATGDAMTLPTGDYTNIGYDFSGWFSAAQGGDKYKTGDLFTGTADTMIYGGWTARTYSIDLMIDGLGITNISAGDKVNATYDSNFTLPVPTLDTDGADMFLGWFSSQNSLSTRYTDEYGNSVGVAKFTEGIKAYPVFIQNVLDFNLKDDDTYEVTAGINFDKVANITIPVTYQGKAVTSILENAFDGRKLLVSINIPNTIKLIGSGAFNGNTNLKAINVYEVEGKHEVIYSSHEGALVRNVMGTITLEVFPRAKTGSFTTPPGVTTIRSKVFQYSNIDEIIISKDVLSIYERAFYSCQKLTSVIFEGGREAEVTIMCGDSSSPDTIFYSTNNITTIKLPAMLAEFNYNYIFDRLTKLASIEVEDGGANYSSVDGMFTNGVQDTILYAPLSIKGDYIVPDGIVSIAASAFKGRLGLTSVTIPMYVESIGSNAFQNCTNVKSVTVEGNRFVDLTIGASAFAGCKITDVKFLGNGSTTTLDNGVITIGSSAFSPAGVIELKNLTFGNGVNIKSIGSDAFGGQSKLSNLVFEENIKIGEIGNNAFKGISITSLSIPASVTKIGSGAFQGCVALKNVTFNEGSAGDITFGSNAFANCTEIETIDLPSTVQAFDGTVFNGCSKLTQIKVNDNNPYLNASNGVLFNESYSTLIYYPRGLAVDSTAINKLPWDKITTIGAAAFSGHKTLKSFEIKKGVTAIGDGAFQNCLSLATLTYEEGAAAGTTLTIGKSAFANCAALASVSIPDYTTVIGDAAFTSAPFTAFEMPSAVTTIGVDAFAYTMIKKITIPANVTTIGAGAFQSTKLSSVTVAESDTLFTFTSSSTKGAFKGCSSLLSIDLKNRATNIGNYTFSGCSNLGFETDSIDSKVIGSNVTSIGINAFENVKVKNITIPASVTSIGNYAFNGMSLLRNVNFAEGTKALTFGSYVFQNCSNLESITFPARATKIDGEVYGHTSTSLAGMLYVSNMPEFFSGCSKLKTINVTPGTNNKYVSKDGVLYKAENGVPTTLLYCPANNPGVKIDNVATLVVPKTVTLVENRSLFNLTTIKTVTFEEYNKDDENYGKQLLKLGRGELATDKVGSTSYSVIGGTTNSITTLNLPSHLSRFGSYSITKTTDYLTLNINPDARDIAIGQYAFSGAKIIKYIFPGIKEMADWTFTGAFSTSSFTANELNTLPFEMVLGEHSTLTKIPSQAFNGAKFETFVFPASVVETGPSAFYTSTRLKNVSFAEGSAMTTIGSSTFGLCSALASVDFSNATNLTSFGSQPFQNCTAMTSFTFPEGVQALGGVFFEGCKNLTEITLSKSFTPEMLYSLDTSNYTNCIFGSATNYAPVNVENIYVHPDNPYFVSDNGILYSADKSIIYFFPSAKDPTGFTIPDTVTQIAHFAFVGFKGSSLKLPAGLTSIGDHAFQNSKLTSITIPSKVESIGNYAFRNLLAAKDAMLTKVIFEDNIKMSRIGEYAFTANYNLKEVINIPDSVSNIGKYAFNGCQSLTEITLPAALIEIPERMFQNCYALAEIEIQQNVQSIGTSAFANCGIYEIELPADLTSIGERAFQHSGAYACPNLTKVTFATGSKLATIAGEAFDGCINLKSINLPASLTELTLYKGSSAGGNTNVYSYSNTFRNCSSLKSISIPGVNVLHDSVFEGCTSLEEVILSDSLESIGAEVFLNTAIKEVSIPATVTSINASAFENCRKLEKVTFEAGNAITEISSSVFKNTASLESITLPSTVTAIGEYAFQNSAIKSVNLNQLADLERIGAHAFENCDNIERAVVGSNVVYLGDYAFNDCNKLSSVSLTFGLEYMGALAFGCCDLLTDGYIPSTVVSIGGNPYAGCSKISTLRIDEDNTFLYVENGSVYDSADKKTLYYYASNATSTKVTLPTSVTTVAPGAFSCSNITEITIPAKITHVAPYTFYGCTKLTAITIENGIKSIGDHAFFGCTTLNNVSIPASVTIPASTKANSKDVITTLGNYAFANCSALSNVTYASTADIYVIGTHLFENCTAMTQVKLPSAYQISDEQILELTKTTGTTFATLNASTGALASRKLDPIKKILPAYMFAGTGIVNAVIPSNVIYLETDGVFMNCASLESVTFQATSLKYKFVGNYMFYNCDSLVEIEIPATTTANAHPLASPVGYVFAECDNLIKVTLYYKPSSSVSFTGEGMFMNCKSLEEVLLYDTTSPYTGDNGGNGGNSGNNDSEEGSGSTIGGSTIGGSTIGGSTIGGSTIGGSDEDEEGGNSGNTGLVTPGFSSIGGNAIVNPVVDFVIAGSSRLPIANSINTFGLGLSSSTIGSSSDSEDDKATTPGFIVSSDSEKEEESETGTSTITGSGSLAGSEETQGSGIGLGTSTGSGSSIGSAEDSEEGSGSTIGGSTIGGSTTGGSTIGGSTIGGSTIGGSTIGGSTIGGSTIGGSEDGGSEDSGSGGNNSGDSSDPLYNEGYFSYIGNNWFSGCESLEEINVMNNAYIGDSAFEGCTSLENVNFYTPDTNEEDSGSEGGGSTIGGSTIGGSTIGGSTIGGSTIGGSTIGGNNGGSTIGGSTIGGSTIGGNNDSEEGSGSAIGGSTIGGSTIGGSTIGGSTIGGNNGGSTIGGSTIGGSTIGGSTIGGNDSEDEGSDTETETSVTLKYLGNNAFKGCTSLTSIDLPGIPENAGTRVFEGWTAEQTINLSNTEEELTEQTENGLFEGCSATINYKAA